MTLDELKEFSETDDGKAVMSSFMEETGYRSKDDVQGLENKKNELLGKLKKSTDSNRSVLELFKKYDIIDNEDLEGKLTTLASAKSNETDVQKMQRRLEIIEKAAKESDERANMEKSKRATSEKKAQIQSALKEIHVDDVSFDILLPYFDRMVKTEEDENGKINLIVESGEGSSPFSSFVDEWSKTDKAKQFIKAPSNRGGGSGGPGNASGGQSMTLEQISQMPNRNDRLAAMAELGANG